MDHTEDLLLRSDPLPHLSEALAPSLDRLGARLDALAGDGPERALTAAERDIARSLRRRRRRRRILTGVAGVAIVAVAAPAAANYLGLHTGHFGHDGGHYGEFLNLDSPEGIKVLRGFERQYPLPRGGTWTAMEQRWRAAPGGEGQVGVFEAAVGGEAQCQWTRAWLAADAAGDRAVAARAADVLAAIPYWHVITAYEDETHGTSKLARAVADAAASGERRPAQQYVDANCTDRAPGR